jgi:hypothetical protein
VEKGRKKREGVYLISKKPYPPQLWWKSWSGMSMGMEYNCYFPLYLIIYHCNFNTYSNNNIYG